MIHSIKEQIAYLSSMTSLLKGDINFTGTQGVGKPNQLLKILTVQ